MTIDKDAAGKVFNSPWINRALLCTVIFFAKGFYSDTRSLDKKVTEMKEEMKEEVMDLKGDIKVLKAEIQLLTDYKIDPKK